MKRLILFLVRKRLGLKKNQVFKFNNQKTTSQYWFTSTALMKYEYGWLRKSTVSLNWLLDDNCAITVVNMNRKND